MKILFAAFFLGLCSFTVTEKPAFADRSKKPMPLANQTWSQMIPLKIGAFTCSPKDFDGDNKKDGFADFVNASGISIELDFMLLTDAKDILMEVEDGATLDDCNAPLKASADYSKSNKYSYAVCADGETAFAWNRGMYVFIVRCTDKNGEAVIAEFMRNFPY